MIRHNLPPQSAAWANDIDRRLLIEEGRMRPSSGARPSEVRNTVIDRQMAPSILIERMSLNSDSTEVSYTWSVPVPFGAKTAWVSSMAASYMGSSIASGGASSWGVFVGNISMDDYFSTSQHPLVYIWALGPVFTGLPEWEFDIDRGKGIGVDVEGKSFIDFTALCVVSDDEFTEHFMRVDLIQTIFWSRDGVTAWGA